jgi:hypothetical protein
MPKACGEIIPAEKLIEATLEAHFETKSYVAATDGGDQPVYLCPECSVKAYVIYDEENGCVWCGLTLDKCGRCSCELTPDIVSAESNQMCSYCNHIMSKDD